MSSGAGRRLAALLDSCGGAEPDRSSVPSTARSTQEDAYPLCQQRTDRHSCAVLVGGLLDCPVGAAGSAWDLQLAVPVGVLRMLRVHSGAAVSVRTSPNSGEEEHMPRACVAQVVAEAEQEAAMPSDRPMQPCGHASAQLQFPAVRVSPLLAYNLRLPTWLEPLLPLQDSGSRWAIRVTAEQLHASHAQRQPGRMKRQPWTQPDPCSLQPLSFPILS